MDERRVTDRFEWASLARIVPTFTHEWPWAAQCAERLHQDIYCKAEVAVAYLRIWIDDTLIGCPIMTFGQHTVNVPRSTPRLLSADGIPGGNAAVQACGVELHDDAWIDERVEECHRRLTSQADRSSREWGITPDSQTSIGRLAAWPSDNDRHIWLASFNRVWRGPWSTSLTTHRSEGATIGWSGHVHRDGQPPELFMSFAVGSIATPMMSSRLRQSSP